MSDPWDKILDKDERIIWQGAPKVRVKMEWNNAFEAPVALFFTGFSIFWMISASRGGGIFWMFGLLFFGVGMYQLVLVHFWKAHQRRNTHYTLTNKRGLIATDSNFNGRVLDSYPLTEASTVTLKDGALVSIYFATKTIQGSR
ncbi:MAG: aspartate carbamoyltransferase catalytic subunit, partial [Pseudomonadota bacterium]